MKKTTPACVVFTAALLLFCAAQTRAAGAEDAARIARAVDSVIRPLMAEHAIPGMSVGVTVREERFLFSYGVASLKTGQKIEGDTLFELGSISKTLTATLAAYAQASGALSLSDRAGKYLPELAGSALDAVSLLDLGAYTAGGLPLQLPPDVKDQKSMFAFFKNWRPAYPPGAYRLYSNPSVGLFGFLAARSLGASFEDLMEKTLFPGLGLTRTYIRVPAARMEKYAQGHTRDGRPVRMAPGVLSSEAYGIKTTATDMLRFLETNMSGAGMSEPLREAVMTTHTGYFTVGGMTQGLGWEMYAYPATLETLLAGNSPAVVLRANKATRLAPPRPPRPDVLFNKTGSTNGFGAYVAFAPADNTGIVLLANKNYPVPARVTAMYRILAALKEKPER